LNVQVFFLVPEVVQIVVSGEAKVVKHYAGLLLG
jgi:hypothetical protein